MYKIYIENRKYTSWTCLDVNTLKEVELDGFIPLEHKIMTNDVVSIDEDNNVHLEFSSTRAIETIPGVLDLKSSKTYGRDNGGSGKLLYKVVPDDGRFPIFLIPYEVKYIGFSKIFANLYVTFKFVSWEGKHPVGVLTSTIGKVDELPNFYEYQLYCRSLNASIQKFNKNASKRVKDMSALTKMDEIIAKYKVEDRRGHEWHIFTIDPDMSTGFDDGFSITRRADKYHISIYISNVTILLDALNLWESFSRRVSTIYLPDRKRPMLPTILSDNLCSLQEKTTRFAMAMDICVNADTGEVSNITYKNCAIRVAYNYRYEESRLHKDLRYKELYDATQLLASRYKYIPHIRNSHDVVCYLMTFMNYHCAQDLLSHKNGIFRSSILKTDNVDIPEKLDEDLEKFMKIWYSTGGRYINASALDDTSQVRHELIKMDAYVHITSPIRRLVDLLNMIQFQANRSMVVLSEGAMQFYRNWTTESEMEYINMTMRSIKKIQNDCSMLEFYTNNSGRLDNEYDGVMFDKMVRTDGTYQYMVYLSSLKLTMRINLHAEYNNFEKHKFRIFLFEDEETLRKKIRLQLVSASRELIEE